ncbi:MAG TPA: ATP cone domain-containing protein, partial [Iamia sp.]|nr:ATP cone domain-containing protein [Iamia sp.]
MTLIDDTRTDDPPAADPPVARASMQVRTRDGSLEPVDVNAIVAAVESCAEGLPLVDPLRVATKTISGLRDGATTLELDELSIRIAASLITEEPSYSRLAARLLARVITKEVRDQGIGSFTASVAVGRQLGLVNEATADLVAGGADVLDGAVDGDGDQRFEFFGLRTVYDRYLLRHPTTR